jgi:predicted DNA-binding transcriptional regulator AlpA
VNTLIEPAADSLRMLNEKQTAEALGVSVAALRKWRFQGRGPAYIKLGKLVRYRREDIDQWLLTRPKGGEVLPVAQQVGGLQ